jgi:hypothetical protein
LDDVARRVERVLILGDGEQVIAAHLARFEAESCHSALPVRRP